MLPPTDMLAQEKAEVGMPHNSNTNNFFTMTKNFCFFLLENLSLVPKPQ